MTTETSQTMAEEQSMNAPLEKNEAWEKNHALITQKIAVLIRRNHRWPTKAEIAEETKLSRQTIYRHITDLMKQDMMSEGLEEMKFMMGEVTGNMFGEVMEGNVRAMRLAYEVTGVLKKVKEGGFDKQAKQK